MALFGYSTVLGIDTTRKESFYTIKYSSSRKFGTFKTLDTVVVCIWNIDVYGSHTVVKHVGAATKEQPSTCGVVGIAPDLPLSETVKGV